ncbi:MAG: CoA pyrophosphatase [Desulfobacterales bacterium]|nr:CoA pyrophosphatase [Desulfobacterales bacterium]MDX2508390.1 CoA pyrophosphatase [Desulfobacterales bacterium]
MLNYSEDTSAFIEQIIDALHGSNHDERIFSGDIKNSSSASAVLFLLGLMSEENRFPSEPCLILNKRSLKVKQAGDLCYTGGSISSPLDSFLAKLLYLPGSSLSNWPYWHKWRKEQHRQAQRLALLFATSLREGFEEMRLNPFRVKFLGPLPPQQLVMFQRVIYPMVCWISGQKRFTPNWEVEKIVYIPLKNLLMHSNYARYRLNIKTQHGNEKNSIVKDFPCFLHEHNDGVEKLWGATFRITMVFLEIVFGFKPPDIESLPIVHGTLDENYLTGNG